MGEKGRIRKPDEASLSLEEATQSDVSSRKGRRKRGGKRKVSVSTIILTLILVAGLGVMVYPSFSDWWNTFHQAKAISAYTAAVEETDPKLIKSMLKAARKFNRRLVNDNGRFTMSDEEVDEYNSLLNLTGNGMMGYVNIPSIGVNLPIYHGVDETHLQVATGHIEGSSLPIGGKSTHAVISAHRGLPSAKLFTDLDQLKEGDIFTFTVLDRTITYEVDQIRIVEPSDLSDLGIDKGKDYATLITCTPYAVNTHRMLVRGHRVKNLSQTAVVPAGAVQIPSYIAVPAVAIPLLFIYLLIALIRYRHRRPELDTEKALETVRKHAMGIQTDENGTANGTNKDANSKKE